MKVLKLYYKEFKESYNWIMSTILGIILLNLYVILRMKKLPSDSPIGISLLAFPVLLILVFIRGYRLIKKEWDWNTKEFLFSLPLTGFELAFAKFLELLTECAIFATVSTGFFSLVNILHYGKFSFRTFLVFAFFLFLIFAVAGSFMLFLETFSLSLRKWRKTAGFLMFIVLSCLMDKFNHFVARITGKLPALKITLYLSGETVRESIDIGPIIVPIIYIILFYVLTGLVFEKRMEV